MINSDFYLILLLISLAAAPLVHLIIAYYIAPKRAKAALLDALVHDDQFQTDLIGTIVKNLMRPIKMKNQQGQDVEIVAIDPVLKRGQEHLEYWLKGKQGKMAQEMTTTDLMKIARKYKKNESQDSLDIFSREGDLEPDDRIKEGKVILPFQGRFRDRSEEKLDPLLYRLRNS